MTLQAKLTLGFVILVVLMVGFISAVDLTRDMEEQFDATLQRAQFLAPLATKYVSKTYNAHLNVPVPEALSDKPLASDLLELLTKEQAILEIAVVDPQTHEVLADSEPTRVRSKAGTYPDFEHLVRTSGWFGKALVLWQSGVDSYYQLERPLKTSSGETVLIVRVLVSIALIRDDIVPALQRSANLALAAVVGALSITFLFSAVAFRPLGRLRRQLDLLVSGEYQTGHVLAAKKATDEVSVMASKVSLLGERLRGAQFEVSDLRGNIERLLQDLEDAVFIFNRERCREAGIPDEVGYRPITRTTHHRSVSTHHADGSDHRTGSRDRALDS